MSSSPIAVTEVVTAEKPHRASARKLLAIATVTASVLLFAPVRAGASAPAGNCEASMRAKLQEIADSAKLPVPAMIVDGSSKKSYYIRSFGVISARPCSSRAVLAHEFGHFVTDVAGAGSKNGMRERSALFKKQKNWLLSTSDPFGAERAAHCVAYVLGVRSAYTRCPAASARKLARQLLEEAQQRAALAALENAAMQARIAMQYPTADPSQP